MGSHLRNNYVLNICWELGNVSETFLQQIATRLPIPVSTLEWNRLSTPILPKRNFILTRFFRSPLSLSNDHLQRKKLLTAIGNNFPNAALIHTGPLARLLHRHLKASGIPIVVHFHGIDAYAPKHVGESGTNYREVFADSAAVIGVSRHMCEQLISIGAPADRVHYVPYFVDPSTFAGATPGTSDCVFLAAGRLVEKKAPLLTILAFSEVVRKHPNAKLVMIGDGPLKDSCSQLIRGLGIKDSVSMLGSQPHSVVRDYMKSSRAFVQHSVVGSDNDHEGTPVVILEAQAAGLPVVSTFHAGIPDVVVDNETGFLVQEFDVQGMASKWSQLAESPVLAARLGANARMRILSDFSFEHTLGKLAQTIQVCSKSPL